MVVVLDASYVLARYLLEHPDSVLRKYERGAYTYYRFDSDTKKIMYRRPSNKRCDGWYVANGLMCYLNVGESRKEFFYDI